MSTIINIFVIKINSIATNASVNIGESVINSPTSMSKLTGANSSFGDEAPPISKMKNIYFDPDVNDMNEIGTHDKAETIQS